MVQINFARKEINCKLVYYGPGMSGKTTNLEMVHKKTPEANKGELTSISTDGDRTLFFDFMPLDLGEIAGMKTKFHLYTVPGQVYYNSTRKLVLNGADGVIFVADSSRSKLQENKESLENLRENLAEMGKDFGKFPIILQWNKRDIGDAMPVEELNAELNPFGFPTADAIAAKGEGVFQTLKALSAKVLASINSTERIGLSGAALGSAKAAPQAAPQAAPPQAPAGSGFRIERNEVGAATCASPANAARSESAPTPAPAPVASQPAAPIPPVRRPPAPSEAPAPAMASNSSMSAPRPTAIAAESGRLKAPSVASARVPVAEPPRAVAPDVQLASAMSRRVGAQRPTIPQSLSQGVRVIGAPPRRESESGSSLKVATIVGVIVAIAAGAATWFFVR